MRPQSASFVREELSPATTELLYWIDGGQEWKVAKVAVADTDSPDSVVLAHEHGRVNIVH